MIEYMAVLHITEAELARDVHAVLEKVREGAEVVIEQDHRPVAVMKASPVKGRNISEAIAALEASGSHATLDDEFAKDLTDIINSHREPLNPPEWD
jgi:antitoxin (DNA-binding transcriptional repressor) of toxin-antitoxin stability system